MKQMLSLLFLLAIGACSDLAGVDDPRLRGLAPGMCSGTPVPCSARTDGRCGGCWASSEVTCHGPVVPRCAEHSTAACSEDPFCTIAYVFFAQCVTKACRGLDSVTCEATPGCGYSVTCSGTTTDVAPCSEATRESECITVSGCTWTTKHGDAGP